MDSRELNNLMLKNPITKTKFRGVFPVDKVPLVPSHKQMFFIINLDPSWEKGSHWVAVMSTSKGFCEYFDSFGWDSPYAHLKKGLLKNNYIFSQKRLQHSFSTTCGQWCLLFIYYRCSGKSYKKFLSLFSTKNKMKNDIKVNSAVEKIFKTDQEVVDTSFLHSKLCTKIYPQKCKTLNCIYKTIRKY